MTAWFLLMMLTGPQNSMVPGREKVDSHQACIKEEARAIALAQKLKVTIKTKCVEAHRRDAGEQ